jgi:hypothetical protein
MPAVFGSTPERILSTAINARPLNGALDAKATSPPCPLSPARSLAL